MPKFKQEAQDDVSTRRMEGRCVDCGSDALDNEDDRDPTGPYCKLCFDPHSKEEQIVKRYVISNDAKWLAVGVVLAVVAAIVLPSLWKVVALIPLAVVLPPFIGGKPKEDHRR